MSHSAAQPAEAAIDPVTFEVIRHRLWAINDEQAMIAARMSGSPIIYEVYDFNSAILDAQGRGLVAGVYIIQHATTIDYFVQRILSDWPRADIREGDMFFTNDPWHGALHSNDGALVTPIFWEGEIVAWSGIAMHDDDVGSPVPGSFVVGGRSRFDEAPLYPMVKLVREFQIDRGVEGILLYNSRTPDNNTLNLRARVAALTAAHERVHGLIGEYGIDTFQACTQSTIDYVERVVRTRLRALPDGDWTHQAYLDHDGVSPTLYPIRCRLTKRGDELTIDFAGTAEQAEGAVNCARPGLEGSVLGVFLMLLCYDLPWSVGAASRIIDIVVDEGLITSASQPAATSMASVSAVLAAQQAVQLAFSKMMLGSEELAGEAQSTWSSVPNCLIMSGADERGRPFTQLDMNCCGGGAGARTFADGIDTGGIFHAMGASIPNVETMESRMPVLVLRRGQAIDSGGAGRYRGGVGMSMAFTPHRSSGPIVDIAVAASALAPSTLGLSGGRPAPVNHNVVVRGTGLAGILASGRIPLTPEDVGGAAEVLDAKAVTLLADGDIHFYQQSGGGGFGDPLRRDPHAVAGDVLAGLVSDDAAAEDYGVILADGEVDETGTERERERMRHARLADGAPARQAWSGRTLSEAALESRLSDVVDVVRADGQVVMRCRLCEADLGEAGSDLRDRLLLIESEIRERGHIGSLLTVEPVAREYVCPGCGVLIAVDVQLVGEELLDDTRIAAAG